ncbi:MAG: hypothetical protein Q9175_002602 [Cornicularia normoerica]
MPTAYEIRAGGDVKNKKQSMADLKLRRLNELNSRLREDLERPRIKVSEASMSLIQYCTNTKDFMVPSMWGSVDKREDPYAPQQSNGCCTIICKWMLRAAYFAQELLSTFSTSLGEVSLIPATGGVFTVDIIYASAQSDQEAAHGQRPTTQMARLWDRKAEGGFPEAKKLKQLVRNVIDPYRDLGHVDRNHDGGKPGSTSDEKYSFMLTGRPSTEKADESIQEYCRTTSSSNIFKASNDDQEQTLPSDADAAVEGGAASEDRNQENRKKKHPGEALICFSVQKLSMSICKRSSVIFQL